MPEQLPLWWDEHECKHCGPPTIADQVEQELEQEATPVFFALLNEEANRRG